MIKILEIVDPAKSAEKLRASVRIPEEVNQISKSIIEDVKKYGDEAINNYTLKFDGATIKELKVSQQEIKSAYIMVTKKQIESVKKIRDRLVKSEKVLLKRLANIKLSYDGVTIHRKVIPLSTVGCYIPGGKARYPSTAIMCAATAKAAGVKRIVAICPPLKDGTIDPLTLVAADLSGADEIYKAGGAQGIAALAYGSQSIPRVDKIVGPGGAFVTAAKIIVSSNVSTDMIAGPTELLVYADSGADSNIVALDLISQAEHSVDTICGLVTTSPSLAREVDARVSNLSINISRSDIVRKSLESNGFIAICKERADAIEFINEMAPEHLEIITRNSQMDARMITSAGLILIGKYTPSSASDYALGSNHVLPTLGFGKSRGSLSVLDFIKLTSVVKSDRKGLARVHSQIKEIAISEGLENHYEAVRGRILEK